MTTSASDIVNNPNYLDNNELAKNKRDAEMMQLLVFDQSHPHPLVIAGILVCVMLAVWILYNFFFKPNLTGIWYSNDDIFEIKHKTFGNSFVIYDVKGNKEKGSLCDSIVLVDDMEIGVWNGKNMIKLFEGGFLKRKVE